MKPAAFLFDMNGTMIDDMDYHRKAWFDIFVNELGSDITEAAAKKEMYGKNEEVLARVFGPSRFTQEEMDEISKRKEAQYQKVFLPHLQLIKGLPAFIEKAKTHGIRLAIGTAAPRTNVHFVLNNIPLVKESFPVIVDAEDVVTSKPDPEVFLKCAEKLEVVPEASVVFEDSPKGVEAAKNGGMKAVVLLTFHKPEEFSHLDNVLMVVNDYEDPKLQQLFQ